MRLTGDRRADPFAAYLRQFFSFRVGVRRVGGGGGDREVKGQEWGAVGRLEMYGASGRRDDRSRTDRPRPSTSPTVTASDRRTTGARLIATRARTRLRARPPRRLLLLLLLDCRRSHHGVERACLARPIPICDVTNTEGQVTSAGAAGPSGVVVDEDRVIAPRRYERTPSYTAAAYCFTSAFTAAAAAAIDERSAAQPRRLSLQSIDPKM